MIKTLHDLPPKVSIYALYCIELYSIDDLVQKTQNGIDKNECRKFDITPEQWQDAALAAIYELGTNKSPRLK